MPSAKLADVANRRGGCKLGAVPQHPDVDARLAPTRSADARSAWHRRSRRRAKVRTAPAVVTLSAVMVILE
jgi:hypothetical protein